MLETISHSTLKMCPPCYYRKKQGFPQKNKNMLLLHKKPLVSILKTRHVGNWCFRWLMLKRWLLFMNESWKHVAFYNRNWLTVQHVPKRNSVTHFLFKIYIVNRMGTKRQRIQQRSEEHGGQQRHTFSDICFVRGHFCCNRQHKCQHLRGKKTYVE